MQAGRRIYTSHNCGKFLKNRKLGRVSLVIRIRRAEFALPPYDYQVRRSLFREFIRGR